jgi:hypothetical protein
LPRKGRIKPPQEGGFIDPVFYLSASASKFKISLARVTYIAPTGALISWLEGSSLAVAEGVA